MAYALDTNTTALTLALTAAFPNVDFSNEAAVMSDPVLWPQVVTFITNFMLKPMVDFANTHSDAGDAATNLIVVPEMERPGGEPIGDPGRRWQVWRSHRRCWPSSPAPCPTRRRSGRA